MTLIHKQARLCCKVKLTDSERNTEQLEHPAHARPKQPTNVPEPADKTNSPAL